MARWSVADRSRALLDRFRAAIRLTGVSDRLAEPIGTRDRAIWALAVSFLFLDLVTTWYGLQLGLRESNQVALMVLSQYGYVGLASVKGIALGIAFVGWSILPVAWRIVAPICLAVPWGLASGYNTLLIASLLGV